MLPENRTPVNNQEAINTIPINAQMNPVQQDNNSQPWSFYGLLFFSLIFGIGGGYILTWQNLKKLGLNQTAKTFLMVGGAILVVLLVILYLLPDNIGKYAGNGIALMFPFWLYYSQLHQWQLQNPGKTKFFTWSIIRWGLLGLVLSILFTILMSVILGTIAPEAVLTP